MRCVVFELAGGHICAPPGRAKVAQTPGRARVNQMYEWNKPPSYYSLGYKIDNFLHTRLRVGMSSLNAHLFSINSPLVDSPHCKCELIPETVKHYLFLLLQVYSAKRLAAEVINKFGCKLC